MSIGINLGEDQFFSQGDREFDFVKKELKTEKIIEGTNGISCYRYIKKDKIELQFCGFEIVLLRDGTYFINDTTG